MPNRCAPRSLLPFSGMVQSVHQAMITSPSLPVRLLLLACSTTEDCTIYLDADALVGSLSPFQHTWLLEVCTWYPEKQTAPSRAFALLLKVT